MPLVADPNDPAMIKMENKTGPIQWEQATANSNPTTKDEKYPDPFLASASPGILHLSKNLILISPNMLKPSTIIRVPPNTSKYLPYFARKLASTPAAPPASVKTMVKAKTNIRVLPKTYFLKEPPLGRLLNSFNESPVIMEKYTDSMGIIHGEIKDTIPAKKAIKNIDIIGYSFMPKNSFSHTNSRTGMSIKSLITNFIYLVSAVINPSSGNNR